MGCIFKRIFNKQIFKEKTFVCEQINLLCLEGKKMGVAVANLKDLPCFPTVYGRYLILRLERSDKLWNV